MVFFLTKSETEYIESGRPDPGSAILLVPSVLQVTESFPDTNCAMTPAPTITAKQAFM